MIDTRSPGTPGWWAASLVDQLAERQSTYDRLDAYSRGDHPLPEGAHRCHEAYKELQAKARTNYVGLVAEAVVERMNVVGFRTGADSDEVGDEVAWRMWQASNLDADSGLVHSASVALGDSYVIVGPPAPDDELPLITPEDPRQVITSHDPARRRHVEAALKTWSDDVRNEDRIVVYLPGQVYHFARTGSDGFTLDGGFDPSQWQLDERRSGSVPFERVPVVRFGNRQDLYGNSYGEFEDVVDIQDRINHMILDRLVVAAMQAFRQRYVKGVQTHDAEGNPIDLSAALPASAGAVWALQDRDVEFGEFGEVNLKPLLEAVESDVQDLGAITRTPPSYLLGQLVNVSADAYTVTESGLVAKVGNRLLHAGESWEQVMSLAFEAIGDEKRKRKLDLEVLWANPKRHTLSEIADAAGKLKDVVSRRTLQRDILQMSPQAIARDESERGGDLLDAVLSGVPETSSVTA